MDEDFTPLEQEAWGGLLGMHGRMMRWIDTDLQEHARITHVEFEALLRLSWADGGRLRIQDLAAQSVITRSGMSRMVERLERVGFVTRAEAREDRRGAYAVLTDAGRQRLRAALRSHVAFVRQQFLTVFNDAELAQMGAFWRRVEAHQAAVAHAEDELGNER